MEPIYQNTCRYSKANRLEMAKRTTKVSYTVICMLVIVYCIGSTIYFILMNDLLGSMCCFLLSVFFILFCIYLPYRNVNRVMRRSYSLYHSEVESDVCFFADYILVVNKQTSGQTKIDYTQIIKVTQTKNLYLLILKENLVVPIDKNGFVKGNRDDFERFIIGKAVNAKIKL